LQTRWHATFNCKHDVVVIEAERVRYEGRGNEYPLELYTPAPQSDGTSIMQSPIFIGKTKESSFVGIKTVPSNYAPAERRPFNYAGANLLGGVIPPFVTNGVFYICTFPHNFVIAICLSPRRLEIPSAVSYFRGYQTIRTPASRRTDSLRKHLCLDFFTRLPPVPTSEFLAQNLEGKKSHIVAFVTSFRNFQCFRFQMMFVVCREKNCGVKIRPPPTPKLAKWKEEVTKRGAGAAVERWPMGAPWAEA